MVCFLLGPGPRPGPEPLGVEQRRSQAAQRAFVGSRRSTGFKRGRSAGPRGQQRLQAALPRGPAGLAAAAGHAPGLRLALPGAAGGPQRRPGQRRGLGSAGAAAGVEHAATAPGARGRGSRPQRLALAARLTGLLVFRAGEPRPSWPLLLGGCGSSSRGCVCHRGIGHGGAGVNLAAFSGRCEGLPARRLPASLGLPGLLGLGLADAAADARAREGVACSASPAAMSAGAQPWVDKYKPRHLGEVIGNTDQVRKLAEWLRDWDDVVFHGKVKEQPPEESWKKFAPQQENIMARAALVSGPPGIGKTTTCCLVARCNPRYKLMEFNASDARSKAVIESMSSSLAGNHTLSLGPKAKSGLVRAVIIMDECDGMAGGDKGGMQALMNMVKTTKNPIICICNDRGDAGVRNLASVCFDLKFRRPESIAVAKRVKHVMESQGKRVDLHTIEAVVEACGHDIRHIINQTQFFGSASAHGNESQKDTQNMLSPFDACAKLLSSTGKRGKLPSMEKRLDMFYLDAEMMPLMIQENYLKTYEKRPRGNDEDDLLQCAHAAEMISLADTMSGNWEVGSTVAVLSTVYPAFLAADESFTRPAFPSWLQKKAPMTKAVRLVQELHSKVRAMTTCTCQDIVTTSYHDLLYRRLLKPLQYGATKECAAALFAAGLTREFFTDQAPAIRAPLQLEDNYKKLEAKVKQQLLQELQALQQNDAPLKRKRQSEGGPGTKKGKKPQGAADGEDAGEAAEGAADAEPGAEGEEGGAGATKRKKATPKKAAGKDKKSASGAGAASLAAWRPKKVNADGSVNTQGEDGGSTKAALMIMKYLDGHTCAVRRTVHLKDILEPWILF